MLSRRQFALAIPLAASLRPLQAQVGLKPCNFAPSNGEMAIQNFARYKITQGPDQCWAACIQMFLNYSGVQINQTELANIVKGSTQVVEAATESDIKNALARRLGRFSNRTTGEPWNLDFLAIPEPAPTVIHGYLCSQRPILLVLESTRHVVVAHKAFFQIWRGKKGQSLEIDNLTYYDPAIDRDVELAGDQVKQKVTSLWLLTASRPSQNVF